MNVDIFWPGLRAKALATVNIGSLISKAGRAWLSCSSAEVAPASGPASSTAAALAEEKEVEAKMGESEESEDNMGFGLFDYTSFVDVFTKKANV